MRDPKDTRTQLLPLLRPWWVEFDSDGRPYTWNGQAVNERAAEFIARHDLAVKEPGFSEERARLVACLER